MKNKDLGVWLFGITEIIIGVVVFVSVALSVYLEKSAKPPQVLIFVLTSAFLSVSLGIGILIDSITSYNLLIFFARAIILSKALIFLKVITLSGALETAIPASLKNIVSVVYHGAMIFYLSCAKKKRVLKNS